MLAKARAAAEKVKQESILAAEKLKAESEKLKVAAAEKLKEESRHLRQRVRAESDRLSAKLSHRESDDDEEDGESDDDDYLEVELFLSLPLPGESLGVRLTRRNVVIDIDEVGIAALCGLRADDRIVSVDGRDLISDDGTMEPAAPLLKRRCRPGLRLITLRIFLCSRK